MSNSYWPFKIPHWYLLLLPTLLFALGFFMNALVISANHDTMPVLSANCEVFAARLAEAGDELHSCMTKASRLKFLADWIEIPYKGTASPGDFLMWQAEYTFYPAMFAWVVLTVKDRMGDE